MCIFSSREGSHNWSNTEHLTALWCWPNPCPPMKRHNSWELCHSISTTHVLALWACWLQHYLTILNCGVSKVKTEKSQESKKDPRSTIMYTNYYLPAFQEEAWFSIFMSLFALKNQNYTSHPAYHFRFDSMGVNEPKNFRDPCQLWSNYHYCYLLQQTLTNICTSHLGSLYCIYCTYSVCPREKGFGM